MSGSCTYVKLIFQRPYTLIIFELLLERISLTRTPTLYAEDLILINKKKILVKVIDCMYQWKQLCN